MMLVAAQSLQCAVNPDRNLCTDQHEFRKYIPDQNALDEIRGGTRLNETSLRLIVTRFPTTSALNGKPGYLCTRYLQWEAERLFEIKQGRQNEIKIIEGNTPITRERLNEIMHQILLGDFENLNLSVVTLEKVSQVTVL